MWVSKSLAVETGIRRTTWAKAGASIPLSIRNASKELEGKRVIVLDTDGADGRIAAKASGVRQLWGSVQPAIDEWALANAIRGNMVGRAIILLPQGVNQATVDRLLTLDNVKKWMPIYIVGGTAQLKGAETLQETGNLVASVVAKVRKLVQK